jgi:hypothetical protein
LGFFVRRCCVYVDYVDGGVNGNVDDGWFCNVVVGDAFCDVVYVYVFS